MEASALASQPLSVEEMRAGQLDTHAAATERLDRLPVQAVRDLAVAHQRMDKRTGTRVEARLRERAGLVSETDGDG
jgi:hypothetical protein